jgi:hypothetical protein
MIAAPWPPGLEPDPIRHGWQCSRPAPEDHYVVDRKTGESRVVRRCPSCHAVEPEQPT